MLNQTDLKKVVVNVEGIRNIVELAAEAGVERFVQCSTIGVHGNVKDPPAAEDAPIKPDDYYQHTKLKGEELARERGPELNLPVVIVRPAAIYGALEYRFLKLARLIASRRFIFHFESILSMGCPKKRPEISVIMRYISVLLSI